MEHVFQFGINIDDEAIKKAVMEQASKAVYKDLRQNVFYVIHGDTIRGFSDQTEEIVKGFLRECKDEIINRVVEELIVSVKHNKNYREAVKEVVNA